MEVATMRSMDLTPAQKRQLKKLMGIFLEENCKLNLSAFRTEDSCWTGNILDSLSPLDIPPPYKLPRKAARGTPPRGLYGQTTNHKLIDVGTGGGFPLLPLAICMPKWRFTGIDATQKKVAAVERIAAKMKLTNVRALTGRAEELGRDPALRESFDIVLSRAVAELPELLEYMSPFAKAGGYLVCWKGIHIEEELHASRKAQEELCSQFKKSHTYDLGEGFGTHTLLIFEKVAPLAEKYPRRTGMPKKRPLR